jgi:hypothetical protein
MKFTSLCDPRIIDFALTVCNGIIPKINRGNLGDMINGKRNKVGIGGTKYFLKVNPKSVRDQETARKDFGGVGLSPAIIETMGSKFKKRNASKLLIHHDGRIYNNMGQVLFVRERNIGLRVASTLNQCIHLYSMHFMWTRSNNVRNNKTTTLSSHTKKIIHIHIYSFRVIQRQGRSTYMPIRCHR